MSRIDEALARARGGNANPVPPVAPPEEGHGTFPSEAEPLAEPKPDAFEPKPDAFEPKPDAFELKPDIFELKPDTPEPKATVTPKPTPQAEAEADARETVHAETLTVNSGDATSTEQYRRLAGRLYLAQAEHGTRIVMVTSALPGEGKTLTATNVALTLAESYKRQVLLIDADLRRPWIHEMFQVPNLSGLNDGLRSEEDHKIPLLRLTDHLSILTAGRPDRDPMSVLSSDRMKRVLQEASARFDWVVIDTPPVALLTDAHLLASLVDAVLIVIQSGKTPLAPINKAIEAVGRERVLGIVLNRADNAAVYRAYDYYGAYGQSAAVEKTK
jgi:capsular exopolysaccharide synthesis family protein